MNFRNNAKDANSRTWDRTRSFRVCLRTGYDTEALRRKPKVKSKNLEPSFGIRLEDRLRTERTQSQVKVEEKLRAEGQRRKREYTEQYLVLGEDER
jgi:hypothetical protein